MTDATTWIALASMVVVMVVVVAVSVGFGGRSGRRMEGEGTMNELGAGRVAAVIVNPTKFDDLGAVTGRLTQIATGRGWAPPLIIETTEDDPGTGQARQAADQGADVVCALGGDGTVRAVAAALVGTDTPLGLLPGGTGNLLARNLDLPVDDLGEAFRVCLDGEDKRIDVGILDVTVPGDTQEEPKDYVFLVMAGVGFDADVMAQAPEGLKAQVGWAAYVVSGIRNLNGPRFGARVGFDDARPEHRRIRSLIVGNVGRLQGGVELLPDAQVDDGKLDTVLLAPKGVVGWGAVLARVLTKQRKGHHRVEHRVCTSLTVHLDREQEVQLDGDPIGPATLLHARVEPLALTVRVIPGSSG